MIPFIQTKNSITVFVSGAPHAIDVSDKRYDELVDALKSNEPDIVDVIEELLNRDKKAVQQFAANTLIEFTGDRVFYNGTELHGTLVDRIIRMQQEGFNAEPLIAFLDRLLTNPSYRVVNSLYEFLEHGKMPITPDGYFLAYKAVRNDYFDIHSCTIDNSIGQKPTMPRNQVNENPEQTCSHGLHVCSWDYLPNFARNNSRVVVCKVDPANVVAIPADYNNTKMRVSEYEVLEDVTDQFAAKNNVLSSKSVAALPSPLSHGDYEEDEGEEDSDDDDYYDGY